MNLVIGLCNKLLIHLILHASMKFDKHQITIHGENLDLKSEWIHAWGCKNPEKTTTTTLLNTVYVTGPAEES